MDILLQTQSIMTDKMEVGEESDIANEKVRLAFAMVACQVKVLAFTCINHVIIMGS